MSSRVWPAFAFALALVTLASTADARPRRAATLPAEPASHQVAFMGYLRDGRVATVYTDARVAIAPARAALLPRDPRGRAAALLARFQAQRAGLLRSQQFRLPAGRYGPLDGDVPPAVRSQILFDVSAAATPLRSGPRHRRLQTRRFDRAGPRRARSRRGRGAGSRTAGEAPRSLARTRSPATRARTSR